MFFLTIDFPSTVSPAMFSSLMWFVPTAAVAVLASSLIGAHVQDQAQLLGVENTSVELRRALSLAEQGRRGDAVNLLEEQAEGGDPHAFFVLGMMALEEDNLKLAEKQYRQAIALGQIRANTHLAQLLLRRGGEDGRREGLERLKIGMANNDGEAFRVMASAIEAGEFGLEKDPARAAILYREGARRGSVEGLCRIAEMLNEGLLTGRKQERQALEIYREAADAGSVRANIYLQGVHLDPSKGPVDRELAWRYGERAVQSGDPDGFFWQGVFWERYGRGEEGPDRLRAKRLFEQASEKGHAEATFRLAQYEKEGVVTPKDLSEARRLFELAATQGNVHALVAWAGMLAKGLGGDQNAPRAFRRLLEVAKQGDPLAMNEVGFWVHEGRGVAEKDPVAAARWFEEASAEGLPAAHTNLGDLHAVGSGVEQDWAKALEHYERAAEGNDILGRLRWAEMTWKGRGREADSEEALAILNPLLLQGVKEARDLAELIRGG